MMPLLFIGHGAPTNALENNQYTQAWKKIAASFPQPKAILCISAHWLKEGTAITAMSKPKTIHDFYGFPPELYRVHYPASGFPKLAKFIQKQIKTVSVQLDQEWGLDHGTWSVLVHMYPPANLPVLQLSLDYELPLEKIFQLGKELAALRQQDVLIIGSGNLVHNLMTMKPDGKPYPWAVQFDAFIKENILSGNYKKLIQYAQHPDALKAHPTNDHLLPLFYVLGAAGKDQPEFFCEKIEYGSVSMRCVVLG